MANSCFYAVNIQSLWQILQCLISMSPYIVIVTLTTYFAVMYYLSFRSGRNADNMGFFIGGRRTPWHVATLAMIGAAMSGVTFISVPGMVATDGFTYMQMVVGFTIGQIVVALWLVPIFYKQGVVSLYEYLDGRFGVQAHKTGAWCFMVAKLIGAALKIYIVCAVMQAIVFDHLKLNFIYNIIFTILFVWLYTRRGGVRSLIVTDVLQSLCLVVSVVVIIFSLCQTMGLTIGDAIESVKESQYSQMWLFDDTSSPRYFWKMVAGGALCLIAMTGLDQDMMQRNLSCRTMRESQINIFLTALCQIGVILLLLALGALLYKYIDFAQLQQPVVGDAAFALVATHGGLPYIVGVMFVIGLISSTYSAAGSALTSLTTSFTIDILNGRKLCDEEALARLRSRVHTAMAAMMGILIVVFYLLGEGSVINLVFKIAGYTYGPILGLFVFGLLSKRHVNGKFIPLVAITAPVLSYILQWCVAEKFQYFIGFELLGYNALFTIFGLVLISKSTVNEKK